MDSVIEKLNRISAAWEKQFLDPGMTLLIRHCFNTPPNLPLKWTVDESGMLFLDDVWICPKRYVVEDKLEDAVEWVNPVAMEIDLIDGSVNIIITSICGEYVVSGVERSVISLQR